MTIDPRVIETYATQASGFNGIFDRVDMEETPIADQENGGMMMTPMIGYTPAYNMMGATGDIHSA